MEDASSEGDTIDNFVPGYVNTTMNLNLGQIDNSTGGLSIYIDIINTTDTTYVASTTSSIAGAEITVSGTINGDAVSQSNILTTDAPSGTVEIVISAPDIDTLDLEQISVVLEERNIEIEIVNLTPDLGSVTYSIDGEQVTLTATLNNNVAFYGWAENSEDGYVPTDLPTYTFEFTDGTPTTYYPIFKALTESGSRMTDESGVEYYSYNGAEDEAQFLIASTAVGEIIIGSTVNIDNTIYSVTTIPAMASYENANITSVVFPSTISRIYDQVLPPFGQMSNMATIYFRSGANIDGETLINYNESPAVDTIIIDSQLVYNKIDGTDEFWSQSLSSSQYVATYKVLSTVDDNSNTFLRDNYTLSSTEVIKGRTYNVYTKN